jgi:hypothetical protein
MRAQKMSLRLIAAVILLSILALPAPLPIAGQSEDGAVLTPLQGLVQRRADSDPEDVWQTITQEELISETDWIQTDHLGMAELTFFEGNLVEILPNSLIQIKEYQFVDEDSPVVTIEQSVGDVHHQIDRILDAESRYEVHTPSAVVTVRGTDFFSGSTWESEALINLQTGQLEIRGISLDGVVGPPVTLEENQSLPISADGEPGTPGPYSPPTYPPPAPLAPVTCGNAICESGERPVCALDCQTSASCGNGICEAESLEGPVTCRVDCVPALRLDQAVFVPSVPETTGQLCTVLTTRGDVVVRAGPGFERGARFYLVTNVNVPVGGKFTDASDNLWWKIQPPDFNPGEADRYWVLAEDVEETGDCALVLDAPASPLIGGQPVQPPQPQQPAATPIPGVTPLPSVPTTVPAYISFYADRTTVNVRLKECATIYWETEGIREVYYQGRGVTGYGSVVECPTVTTTYTLRVILVDGSTTNQYVTITVTLR